VGKIKAFAAVAALSLAVAGNLWAQAPAGSPVAEHGALKVDGSMVLDKNNEPVQLRGMSLYWTLEENARRYYNANVVRSLWSEWKGNVIRAAMGVGGCKGSWKPGYSSAGDAHDKAVEDVVTAAVATGIYVIIDWHSHEAHNQTSAAQAFFERVAAKYKDTPNVIFEIYNEPIDISGCEVDFDNANFAKTWSDKIKPYSETIVSAIRNKGADNLIILGTPYYCLFPGTAAANPVTAGGGKNLLYSFHFYAATHPVAQRSGEVSKAISAGKAVFVSEFGTVASTGDGTPNTAETDKWFQFLDRNQIGWANWSFSNMGQSSAVFSGDASNGSFSSLSASGTYISNKLKQYATTTFTVTATVDGKGKITTFPSGSNGKFGYGVPVTLTAVADPGWEFSNWSGDASGNTNTVKLSPLYANASVKAVFVEGGNIIKNGKFNGTDNWGKFGTFSTTTDGGQGLKFDNITATAGDPKSVYLYQEVPLVQNHKYKLTFKAKTGTGTRKLIVAVTSTNTVTAYMTPLEASLTTTMSPYSTEFTFTRASGNARVLFQCGDQAGAWYLDDVRLEDLGLSSTVVRDAVSSSVKRTPWSLVRTAGGVQLRGPIEAGATAAFYNTRGKLVGRVAIAADGHAALSAGVPAGGYLVVVRDRAGAEVHKTRFSLVD